MHTPSSFSNKANTQNNISLRHHIYYLIKRSFLFLIAIQFTLISLAFSSDQPFDGPANWGGTGLMEIPTARVLEDGVLRIGYAEALPYRWYNGCMGVFPGLELSGRFTEFTNLDSDWEDYGNDKDKALDVKYQMWPESEWIPAIAIGVHDFHGTRLFPAEYAVLSKQFFSFDITLGAGTKRLSGYGESDSENIGLFGGIEWVVHERLHLIAEYNPIDYQKDKKVAVPEGAQSQINAGLRINVIPGFKVGLSYQRGDTLGLMCHFEAKLGRPISHKKPDPPLWAPVDRRLFGERAPEDMVNKIQTAVQEAGFKDVLVYTDGKDLCAEFENIKYISNEKAAGRVLRILLFYSPYDTQLLHAIIKKRKIPIIKATVRPDHMERYILDQIPKKTFLNLIQIEAINRHQNFKDTIIAKSDSPSAIRHDYGIKPEIELYLNDPSGVFKFKIGIQPWIESSFWKGASTFASYDIPFYSNISSSNEPEPDAVRSDSWLYSQGDPTFDRLMFDQALKLTKKTYARLSLGYLEKMYAGVGGEILMFLGGGSLAVGIEGDWVKKREPGAQLALMDFERHTILGNAYWNITGADIIHHKNFELTAQARYGHFLAGDIGWRFDLSRHYDNGVVIGFWYSDTDTSDLSELNQGYHDKGIFMQLPAGMFFSKHTNTKYYYSVVPWTRDVAATIDHWKTIYSMASELMPGRFKHNMEKLKE